MNRFPKIFQLGQPETAEIFSGEVEITEKIDGSQFIFGLDKNGTLKCASKNQPLPADPTIGNAMFAGAITAVLAAYERLGWPEYLRNLAFYGECMRSPRHNKLTYKRVPRGHVALFGASDFDRTTFTTRHSIIADYAEMLELDVVPLLYEGVIEYEQAKVLIDRESALGGVNMEGAVIKNYDLPCPGKGYPITCAKIVSDGFKERMRGRQRGPRAAKDFTDLPPVIVELGERFTTDARFDKGVQFLAETGNHTESMRDMQPLVERIRADILEEHGDEIRQELEAAGLEANAKNMGLIFKVGLQRLPAWYKARLEERFKA